MKKYTLLLLAILVSVAKAEISATTVISLIGAGVKLGRLVYDFVKLGLEQRNISNVMGEMAEMDGILENIGHNVMYLQLTCEFSLNNPDYLIEYLYSDAQMKDESEHYDWYQYPAIQRKMHKVRQAIYLMLKKLDEGVIDDYIDSYLNRKEMFFQEEKMAVILKFQQRLMHGLTLLALIEEHDPDDGYREHIGETLKHLGARINRTMDHYEIPWRYPPNDTLTCTVSSRSHRIYDDESMLLPRSGRVDMRRSSSMRTHWLFTRKGERLYEIRNVQTRRFLTWSNFPFRKYTVTTRSRYEHTNYWELDHSGPGENPDQVVLRTKWRCPGEKRCNWCLAVNWRNGKKTLQITRDSDMCELFTVDCF